MTALGNRKPNLLPVLANRSDNIERECQRSAPIFQGNHRRRSMPHRVQK
jgi:hypothetical protein